MRIRSLKLSVFRVVWSGAVLCAVMSYVGEKLSGMLWNSSRESSTALIPQEPPREQDRVRAEDGFSLIGPPGWTALRPPRGLLFVSGSPSVEQSRLELTRLEERHRHPVPLPETDRFQDQPAYCVVRNDSSSLGQAECHELFLVIERDGECYEFRFASPVPINPPLRAALWQYFESFATRTRPEDATLARAE
jgi:hypothetical protein